jgi:hypothetical protein
MHIIFNHRFCSLLGSWHDLPAYRVDAGVSELNRLWLQLEGQRCEDYSWPYARVFLWSWRRFASIDLLRRCFTFLDSVLLDLYPTCAKELYSDVVIILCNSSFIPVLYGFVPLETSIARDSLFLGLSQRCRELGFRSRKFGSFHYQCMNPS